MNKRLALLLCAALLISQTSFGARVSDVRATVHNLSNAAAGTVTPTGTVPTRNVYSNATSSGGTDQVCVFCHTPHGASLKDLNGSDLGNASWKPALWNRKIPRGSTYTGYTSATSSSLDAATIQAGFNGQPGGSSKLCLSCHDGTLAIGSVNVWNGSQFNVTSEVIQMTGTKGSNDKTFPVGPYGESTGFTRDLGVDLSNDHPISVTYNSALANLDGELRVLDNNQKYPATTGTVIGVKSSGYKPKLPLEPTGAGGAGQVQCATCHDPHLREADATAVDYANPKFLRLNRFQSAQPTGTYSQANDIICLACHEKAGASWAYSAHANNQVATQTYLNNANSAQLRQFPSTLPVWKGACLNCHDTHTVSGARRLLREGTNAQGQIGASSIPKPGGAGTSAIEETCYQCHDGGATIPNVLSSYTTVPNIKSDFTTAGNKIMPIAKTPETHDIGGNFTDSTFIDCSYATNSTNKCGKDFIEQRTKLGVGDTTKRHVECTDCHNPHRVVKFKDFRGPTGSFGSLNGNPDGAGTHPHNDSTSTDTSATNHTNIISGVLRGAWGVEPIYNAATKPTSFHTLPSGYTVKRGDPGSSPSANVGDTYVTREYQICLKCHSDYGYSDNNAYPTGNRPSLGSPGTASGVNGLSQYTNQAKEFQPAGAGEVQDATGSGAGSAYEGIQGSTHTFNHRSWHPVMAATGRSIATRGINIGNPWRLPWSNTNQVGAQTMYCTDCHGSTTSADTVRPRNTTDTATEAGNDGKPWGPHGSSNDFLLKGSWDKDTGRLDANGLCFRCHDPSVYRSTTESGNGTSSTTGFSGPKADNLHGLHGKRIGNTLKCMWCHVAVPHGWKNKALLVNLNDVSDEAGYTGGSKEVAISGDADVYNKAPYYQNAKLKVIIFAQSNKWTDSNCGSSGKTGANLLTKDGNSSTIADAGVTATSNTTGSGKSPWMTSTCKSPP